MQTFTTQSHQRNYQGNVVVETSDYQARLKKKRNKILSGITTAVMALAIIATSGLLGATTIHNQQLKHQVKTLQTQTTQVDAVTEDIVIDEEFSHPMTLEMKHDENTEQTETKTADTPQRRLHRSKKVKPLPVVEQA